MCEMNLTNYIVQNNIDSYKKAVQYDPTKTVSLRNAFARDMRVRFNELIRVIKKSIDTNDCFGLKEKNVIIANQMYPVAPNGFDFPRSQQKIEAFMSWLQQQVDNGIITVVQFQQIGKSIENAWFNLYIADSYKRGIARARQEMLSAGLSVPSITASGGIDAVFGLPMHMDRVGILYTRTFNLLKGVTDDMAKKISEILAQGMIDGDNPVALARKLVSVINGEGIGDLGITDSLGRFIPARRRAEMIARSEIIRAYAESSLQEYKNWGVFGVSAKVEFATAGDQRVCPQCSSLQNQVFSLEEASGIIPVHPSCRCTWLPYIESNQKYM